MAASARWATIHKGPWPGGVTPNLVTALHEETGIDLPERDYPVVATIDGFITYVAAADAAGTEKKEAHDAT